MTDAPPADNSASDPSVPAPSAPTVPTILLPVLVMRSVFGGVLMGLANLVPGISGGTMLLAAGVYPGFIQAIAELTRLKFRFRSMLTLGCIVVAAGLAVLLLAGVLKDLVVDHRWAMYSLFIGLTLGGVPIVWRLVETKFSTVFIAASFAFGLMVVLAALKYSNYVGGGQSGPVMLFLAGLAGASAMILPGLSGGYLLLLMGQYVPILSGVHDFKEALKDRDFGALMEPLLGVVLPVGLGVLVGVVAVGNLLQWLLNRFRQATLGVLLGLLLGSTIGLWPFQNCVPPQIGDQIKGQAVTAENIDRFDREDWPTVFFRPDAVTVASSLGLVLVGYAVTAGVAFIGTKSAS